MKSLFATLAIFLTLGSFSSLLAQDSAPTEGYVVSLRSLYEGADANSNTVGFLRPGEFVKLEHVHSLVYRVFRDDSPDVAGYVVYPKISSDKPAGSEQSVANADSAPRSTASIRKASNKADNTGTVTNYSTVVRAASYGATRWVHRTSNIRAGMGTNTPVVAQLPSGTAVKIGTTSGSWASVYRSTDTSLDPTRSLGFVHVSLLKSSPPNSSSVSAARTSIASVQPTTPEPTEQNTGDTTDGDIRELDGQASSTPILQALSTAGTRSAVTSDAEIDHTGHDHTENVVVYVTKTGKKYHVETCRHLKKSKREITLKEAKEKNFQACKTCKPDKKLAEAASESKQ